MRADLARTTRSGLLDQFGAPLPSAPKPAVTTTIDIRTLPVIAADALPPLPKGIEARLYQHPRGDNHIIVLWSPVHEIGVEVPLADHAADHNEIGRVAEMMAASFPTRISRKPSSRAL